MDFLIDDLSNPGDKITLEVDVDNKAALALYQKFGFEVISIRKGYYNGQDAYLMGRSV